jgi:hypothetical protein
MAGLFVKRFGQAPRVVLWHGGVLAGELCWRLRAGRDGPLQPLAHRAR